MNRVADLRHSVRGRRNDFAPIFMLAVPVLSSLVQNAFLGAMTASVKEKVVDPLVDKSIDDCKKLIADRGKNEAYTSAIMRNLKKNMNKLSSVLKWEKAPIANKIKGIADKIAKADKDRKAKLKKKKDMLVLRDDNSEYKMSDSTFTRVVQVIVATLTGIIMFLARPQSKKKVEHAAAFAKSVKDNPDGAKGLLSILKGLFRSKDLDGVPEAQRQKLKEHGKLLQKLSKQKKKGKVVHPLEQAMREHRAKRNISEPAPKASDKEMKKFAQENAAKKLANSHWGNLLWRGSKITNRMGQVALEKMRSELNKLNNKSPYEQELEKTYKKAKELMEKDPSDKEINRIFNHFRERKATLEAKMKKEAAEKAAEAAKKAAEAAKAAKRAAKTVKTTKDSLCAFRRRQDSRLKRSQKWPGRATTWEIKMALNFPAGGNLPPNYVGQVDGNGNVVVYDKNKRGAQSVVARMPSEELNRRAMAGGEFSAVGGVGWVGRLKNPYKQFEVQKQNAQKLGKAVNGVMSILQVAGGVAGLIGTITEGTSSTINGVANAANAIRAGIDVFRGAKQTLSSIN